MNFESKVFQNNKINLQAFSGTWYIVQTSLPFWKNKFNPIVTYTLLENNKILDEVRYTSTNGKPSGIVGYDRSLNENSILFEWTAKPWYLRFLKSTWGVLAHDDEYQQWAITCFSKTTFTPAGVDIYSRMPNLDKKQLEYAQSIISGIDFLAPYLSEMFSTKRN